MKANITEVELARMQPANQLAAGKICIVTGELEGPHFNGGVGTTNRALALVLRSLGYEVDILYVHVEKGIPLCLRGTFAEHVAAYRNLGIQLLCIDNQADRYNWQARSYLSLQHLLRNRYDLVFFDDMDGAAYYPLLARRTGNMQLRATTMCVTAHSAFQWVTELNQTPITKFESLSLMEMERRSIELADVVKAPSAYILRKYRSYGWTVSDNFIVFPNFVSAQQAEAQPIRRDAIKEIVFFGRLETRKGLEMFHRSLDRLKYILADYLVTFLGKTSPEAADTLLRRSVTWPFSIRLLSNFNREQALAYLKGSGRLAVMPSPEDNSPSAILECVEEGIPFLASSGSGGEELLDEESRARNLFKPSVDGLCEKLLETLADGATTARASFDNAQLRRSFGEWVEGLLKTNRMQPRPKLKRSAVTPPALIVVVPPEYDADQCLAELRQAKQAYNGQIEIHVLAAKPEKLRKRLELEDKSLAVNIESFGDFQKLARSLADHKPTVLGLCHVSQVLQPAWFERARNCFAMNENISAITGMVAATGKSSTKIREPFVSTSDRDQVIDRYVIGYAPPLFPFLQDTNSGFVLMRSELLALGSGLAPVDEQYGRLKPMQTWIHEILVTLFTHGRRFEVVPDLTIERSLGETPSEVPCSSDFVRSLASTLYGYAPGTDQWLVARLIIDAGLVHERSRAKAKYRTYLAEKFGTEIMPVNGYTSWRNRAPEVAMIAHASGQIELASDLLVSVAVPARKSTTLDLRTHVKSAALAVKLMELLSTNQYAGINLNHEWSFKLAEGGKELELHANPVGEGRTALVFSSVDLSELNYFTCLMRSPGEGVQPLRVRIDVISQDRRHHCSAEKALSAGEVSRWGFELAANVRTTCTVVLAVEMVDQRDIIVNAYVRISDPVFTRMTPEDLQ
jgi:glycosyltransferase involved in cell wall biosynthesis